MATIRVACPDCGDVELHSSEITVLIHADGTCGYRFRCPKYACRRIAVKHAEPRTAELLLTSGARKAEITHAAELDEPRSGPPITADDCLDAHNLWASDEALWIDLQDSWL